MKLVLLLILGVALNASPIVKDKESYDQAYIMGEQYASLINSQNPKMSSKDKTLLCSLYIDALSLEDYFKKEALKSCILSLGVK